MDVRSSRSRGSESGVVRVRRRASSGARLGRTEGDVRASRTEQGRAFLQRRVAQFGLVAAGLGLLSLVFRVGITLAARQTLDPLLHPSMGSHLASSLCFLSIWVLTRGKRRERDSIRAVEAVGLVTGCAFAIVMGTFLPERSRPEYIMVLAMFVTLMARSIYVPSSARRSFALTAIIGVPLVVGTWIVYTGADLDSLGRPPLEPDALRGVFVGSAAMWWTLITVLCTATSHVVYGLRQQVRRAEQLGQYILEGKLGEGGMGVVYRARHAMLRRPTAVKMLSGEHVDETDLARFEREVRLTAGLTHPNTVTVYDYGRTPEGVFYYAMELLDGATVDEIVQVDGRQPASRVAIVLARVAAALEEAHAVGLIHRDVKPSNVMLCVQGGRLDTVKVLDFGLVKQLGGGRDRVSLTGEIVGTPCYMSPEAIAAPDDVDARSDIYGLGALGYFMLTGEDVFTGRTAIEVCAKHIRDDPEPPSERICGPLPEGLESLLLDCLAKEPDDRPQSATEVLERLEACGGLEVWSQDDARAWWADFEARLRERRRIESSTTVRQTMAVDVARRVEGG